MSTGIENAVNPLGVDAWMRTYGRVWRRMIEADAWSIMTGHISFPAWQGFAYDTAAALAATLCPRLQVDLLRKELGFEGVIVSDAAPMIGLSSRVPEEKAALAVWLGHREAIAHCPVRQPHIRIQKEIRHGIDPA